MAEQFITGRLLFEAFDTGTEWTSLSSDRQSHYNNIAGRLNAQYLASQQAGPTITGQAIHDIYNKVQTRFAYDELCPWAEIKPERQATYSRIAQELNQQYLAPLQGLVMQWRQLLQERDEVNLFSMEEIEDWNKQWELLKRRSRELLGEEIEVMASIQEIDSAVIQRLQQENAELQQKIDAFTSLLASYQKFVKRACADHVFFQADCAGLLQITETLLSDEQKVKE
jgi:hypothetical protein